MLGSKFPLHFREDHILNILYSRIVFTKVAHSRFFLRHLREDLGEVSLVLIFKLHLSVDSSAHKVLQRIQVPAYSDSLNVVSVIEYLMYVVAY